MQLHAEPFCGGPDAPPGFVAFLIVYALYPVESRDGIANKLKAVHFQYPEQELAALAGDIRKLANKVKTVQVVFNNNYEDQGQRNARTLMGLLEKLA